MHPSTLKTFNDILDVTDHGDYEAHSVDGDLKANVGTFDNTGIIYVTLPKMEDIHMYTNCRMMNRYIELFTDAFDLHTSENAILLSNDKLEVLLPMVSEENAKKNTKALKQAVVYDDALTIKIKMDDIKTVFKASKKQDDLIIKFNMDEFLVIEVGKVKRKLKEITGPKPCKWGFKYDVIERVLVNSGSDVTFTLSYNTRMPVKIQYTAGPIIVEAYVMGFDLSNEEA